MALAYLHGEGVVFSSLIHLFLALLGGGALLYGLAKHTSLPGAMASAGYVAAVLIITLLSQRLSSLLLESIAWGLTLPWSGVVPCYNLDSACPLSPGVSLISAVLNAAVLYFVVRWVARVE